MTTWADTGGSTTQWRRLRLLVLQRDNYRCMINGPRCKGRANEIDHIVPVSQGGSMYDINNCRAACRTCNAGRRDKPTEYVSMTDWGK